MKKLLLVDGNSMLFRAYYATAYGKPMTSSSGIPTNAIYGFALMLQKAIDKVEPDYILVPFDAGKHTFRHDLYPDYKGGRKPAPDDLVAQFSLVRDYLDSFHIKWVEKPDIEADDLIGSMAKSCKDCQSYIFSSDHDLLQLVDDHIEVLLMKKGLTELDEVTPSFLKETMGIVPSQIIDLKGLMGDHSDNIPGVSGIGEKTALKLLAEYETVENVLDHADEIKGATGKKISAGKESAILSKTLATIKTDVELDFSLEDCKFDPDYNSLIKFFETLDMKSLIKQYQGKLAAMTIPSQDQEENNIDIAKFCETAISVNQPEAFVRKQVEFKHVTSLPKEYLNKESAIFLEEDNASFMYATIYGFALAFSDIVFYITLEDVLKDSDLLVFFKNKDIKKIGYDIKRNKHLLERANIDIHFNEDAMIIASLVDSSLTSTDKIFDHFGITFSSTFEDVFGKTNKPKLPELDAEIQYSCERAKAIYELYQEGIAKIKEYQMESLYYDMELPLTDILCRMEDTGIICNQEVLAEISKDMKEQMDVLQKDITSLAGKEFNLNSPKQLATILYDDLGLPSGKKRSTSAEVLEKLNGIHPIIEKILSYRKIQKIYSTYAEGLQKYIQKDGRIHTIYNQCATQTGRLSSSEPNLQNISVRDEQGKIIRKAFLPSENNVLISSDYHQVELRMLAHMADEDSLIEAFNSNIDIHTKTAMDVFHISKEEVDSDKRRRAKTVNFGIVYGISDFGLAEQLGISRKEASEFIASYYASYPKIKTYMDSLVESCKEKGYVTTLCNRRRDIPEIHDKNHMIREFGKRAAMNAPIQGSAADLIKLAMIRIDQKMKEANVKSKMILQVHDELIFDVAKDEIEIMRQIIEDGMTHAMELKVPLTAECAIGSNWYEAK